MLTRQAIVLFLFGFPPTGHKKFHLPQFSKKNTTEFKRHKLQKKNLLFKINQNSRSFVLVWITISSFLKCQLTKPLKKGIKQYLYKVLSGKKNQIHILPKGEVFSEKLILLQFFS